MFWLKLNMVTRMNMVKMVNMVNMVNMVDYHEFSLFCFAQPLMVVMILIPMKVMSATWLKLNMAALVFFSKDSNRLSIRPLFRSMCFSIST